MSIKNIEIKIVVLGIFLLSGCQGVRKQEALASQRSPTSTSEAEKRKDLKLSDFTGTYQIAEGSDKDCPDGVFSVKGATLRIGAEYSIKEIGGGQKNIAPHRQYRCRVRREAKIEGRVVRETRQENCGKDLSSKRKITLTKNSKKGISKLALKIETEEKSKNQKKKTHKKTCHYEKAHP